MRASIRLFPGIVISSWKESSFPFLCPVQLPAWPWFCIAKNCFIVFVFLCWSKTKEASVHALILMIQYKDIFDHEYTHKKKKQIASVHIKVIILKPWNTNKWHIMKSTIIHASLESQLINTDTNVQYSTVQTKAILKDQRQRPITVLKIYKISRNV